MNILINNASFYEKDQNYKCPESDFLDGNLELHFKNPLKLIYGLFEHFGPKKPLQIINFLDTQIKTLPNPQYFSYWISKKALANSTLFLAKNLGPNVRVNGIAPGPILAPEDFDPDLFKDIVENTPLKRPGELSNITKCIEFLLENDYLTGQILYPDGGQSL